MLAISQEPTVSFHPHPQRKQRKTTILHTNSIQTAYGLLMPAALQRWGCCSSVFLGPASAEAENVFPGCAHSTNGFILLSSMADQDKSGFLQCHVPPAETRTCKHVSQDTASPVASLDPLVPPVASWQTFQSPALLWLLQDLLPRQLTYSTV